MKLQRLQGLSLCQGTQQMKKNDDDVDDDVDDDDDDVDDDDDDNDDNDGCRRADKV